MCSADTFLVVLPQGECRVTLPMCWEVNSDGSLCACFASYMHPLQIYPLRRDLVALHRLACPVFFPRAWIFCAISLRLSIVFCPPFMTTIVGARACNNLPRLLLPREDA